MKKKIFAFVLAFMFVLPCAFLLSGCGKKKETWQGQISWVDADSVTNYWVEYSQTYSHHHLTSIAKITKDGVSYYYAEYENNGNWNTCIFKVDTNGYEAYAWDNSVGQKKWYRRDTYTDPHNDEYGIGTDWYNFKSGAAAWLSDYFGMAFAALEERGEVNSFWRHENGTDVKYMGEVTWTTTGYPYPNYLEEPVNPAPEEIENCLHFYDEQNDENYYFAPETHFLLYRDSSLASGCTTKVYKRVFDMNDVLALHGCTTTGLPFDLPSLVPAE